MVIFVLGTTAEAIKLAPLMKGFSKLGVNYSIISTGQQGKQAEKTLHEFGVSSEIIHLNYRSTPISSVGGAVAWFMKVLSRIIFVERNMLKSISGGDVAWVVHGDTLSTLLGTLFALRMRGRLIHVEAGLRSNKVLHPFPEELVRRAVARFSAVNFAPSIDAVANLRRSPGKTILTRGNTAIDAMDLVQDSKNIFYEQPYCLVLLHRTEFVRNSAVMVDTLGELVKISKELSVVMVQDFASEMLIRKYSSEIGSLVVIEKQGYVAFQNLLNGASFVITDSGGLQEECAILGKPCLVHRKATERIDGLGENAVLSLWKRGAISDFSSEFKNYERDSRDSYISPTSIIIDELQSLKYL